MMFARIFALLAAISLCVDAAGAAEAAGEQCLIADPADTSLNVRDAPNGQLINRLRNGRKVFVQEIAYDDKARAWANVSGYYDNVWRRWGWVFHRYLDCSVETDAVPVQSGGYPLVFGRASDLRPLGLVLRHYGPDGFSVEPFANRCHYYGDGGNDMSVSDSLLRHYEARGFSLNSLCMALVSGIVFDPETGSRLPSFVVVDERTLRQYGVADAGVLSEELPLDIPACFARGLPYSDCRFNYHPRTGARLSDATASWFHAAGDELVRALEREIASGSFAEECTCAQTDGGARMCRIEKRGKCPDEQYVVDRLGIEAVAYRPPQQAWIGFFDVSPRLPKGFGYALFADGAAGPSGAVGSEKLVLAGKNRATKARIQDVLNARARN